MNYEEESYVDSEYTEKKSKPAWMKNFQNLWSKDAQNDADYYEEMDQAEEITKSIAIWTDEITMDSAKMIIENLKDGQEQIINFENTDPETEHDVRYILYGAVYALEAKIDTISERSVIIVPEGSVIEKPDSKPKKTSFIGSFRING